MFLDTFKSSSTAIQNAGGRLGRLPHEGNFKGPLDCHSQTFRTGYLFGKISLLNPFSSVLSSADNPNELDSAHSTDAEDSDVDERSGPGLATATVRHPPAERDSLAVPNLNVLRPPDSVVGDGSAIAPTSQGGDPAESVAPASLGFVGLHSSGHVSSIAQIFLVVSI